MPRALILARIGFVNRKTPGEWKRLYSERLAEECLTVSQPRALSFESRRFSDLELDLTR